MHAQTTVGARRPVAEPLVEPLPVGVERSHGVAAGARGLVQALDEPRGDPAASRFRRDSDGRDAGHPDALAAEPRLEREEKTMADDRAAVGHDPQVVEPSESVVSEIAPTDVSGPTIRKRGRVDVDETLEIVLARRPEGQAHRAQR